MIKTNTKIYKERINAYILDCIDSEDENQVKTPEDKMAYFFNRFEREYNHDFNKRMFPNLQNRIAQWLMGLPFNFEFNPHSILELTEKLHDCKLTKKEEGVILNKYWEHLAFHILKLNEKFPQSKSQNLIDKIAQKEFDKNYSDLNAIDQYFVDDAYACIKSQ